jgi:hypothetical protein
LGIPSKEKSDAIKIAIIKGETAMKYVYYGLTASVWIVICAALLNAGIIRHFDPERDCDASKPMTTVCKGH